MPSYRVRSGVSVEAIGRGWAAFSPASGDTQLLNDEAAAVLEVLSESARTAQDVVQEIARDTGQPLASVEDCLEDSFLLLQTSGLIEELRHGHSGV